MQDDLIAFLGLNSSTVSPAAFPFFANKNIWRHDKAQTPSMSDDWFGEAVARPDIVHSDLKKIFAPGSAPKHATKFFRNFSKGEKVTVSGPEECKEFTCAAYSEQKAITTGVDMSSSTTSLAGAMSAAALFAAVLYAHVFNRLL
jgi:hypothetical protein